MQSVATTKSLPRIEFSKRVIGSRRGQRLHVSACLQCQQRRLPLSPAGTAAPAHSRRLLIQLHAENGSSETPPSSQTDGESKQADNKEEKEEEEESVGVRIALSMLRFYKNAISPLLQPACRFQPTCSAYSMDAYKKYGVGKGTVLTAWRIVRCQPWGNSGYDPVQWPPPGLEWAIKE